MLKLILMLCKDVITENIYIKCEADNMFEDISQKFDRRFQEVEQKIDLRFEEIDRRFQKTDHKIDLMAAQLRLEMRDNGYRIIGILGTLIVIVGAISTLSHYFFH